MDLKTKEIQNIKKGVEVKAKIKIMIKKILTEENCIKVKNRNIQKAHHNHKQILLNIHLPHLLGQEAEVKAMKVATVNTN